MNGNGDCNSGPFTPTATGTYYWPAVYNGDVNNAWSSTDLNEAGESSVVNKAQPSISTAANPSWGDVGVTLNDSATSRAASTRLAASSSGCSGRTTRPATWANRRPSSPRRSRSPATAPTARRPGIRPPSSAPTTGRPATAGTTNNLDAASACADEPVVISKAASAIATNQFVYPNDKATVSEAVTGNITGNVQFRLFNSLTNCQNDDGTDTADGLLYKETVALPGTTSNSKTVETSNATERVSADATVYWRVIYDGDTQHHGRLSVCVENTIIDFTDDPGPGTAP